MDSHNSSAFNGKLLEQIPEAGPMPTDGLLLDDGVPDYAKVIIKQQQALIATLMNMQQQEQSRYASTISLFQQQQQPAQFIPSNNEPPPGIPATHSPPPGISYPIAPVQKTAPPPPPPGFRAPPGFDNSVSSSKFDLGSIKSDNGSKKFDISEDLKKAFAFDDDGAAIAADQSSFTLSPRSQNVQAAQNACLPMSSSFSSNENLQQDSLSPIFAANTQQQHISAEQVPPLRSQSPAASSLSASELCYQLANKVVLNYEQVHEQKEKWADETLTIVDRQPCPDRHVYQRFANLGAVLYALQRLYRLHPDGFTVAQYVQFENREKRARPTQEGFFFSNTMPTVISLLESDDDLLRVDLKNEKFHVSEDVTQTQLFCLSKNLCSNLFRLLRRYTGNAIRVQHLLEIAPKLVPAGTSVPDSLILMDLCNRYPTIFKLCCLPQDHYRFDNSVIMLNEKLMNSENLVWRIVLDTDEET